MSDLPAILKVLDAYCATVKSAHGHATRITVLADRARVLGHLHTELYRKLMLEHEQAKEILEAGDDPSPPAFVEFMAHYEEFKLVYKMMQDVATEAAGEGEFLEWIAANVEYPEKEIKALLEGK